MNIKFCAFENDQAGRDAIDILKRKIICPTSILGNEVSISSSSNGEILVLFFTPQKTEKWFFGQGRSVRMAAHLFLEEEIKITPFLVGCCSRVQNEKFERAVINAAKIYIYWYFAGCPTNILSNKNNRKGYIFPPWGGSPTGEEQKELFGIWRKDVENHLNRLKWE